MRPPSVMLTYPLDDRGGLSLYEYLYRRIRDDILSGALPVGARLPSRRALAEHLGVSVITAEGAYRQLEAEGYVYTSPRRGIFVSRIEGRPPRPAEIPEVSGETPAPVWKLDLASNRMDPSFFPSAAWARLTRQVLGSQVLLSPPPHQGLPRLRRAIAKDLRDYRGMAVSPEQIVVGAGAEYLYLLLAQLLGHGTVMAVEEPGYPKIRLVYEKCGLRTVPTAVDGQGMDMEALSGSGADAVHLSPAHHYPTGAVMPIARRHALLRWAEQTEGVLIEDDYDSEFRFTGRPIPTLQSIDAGGRVIYMNTYSQTLSRAMRFGYMVLPPRLLDEYRRELGFYSCTVPVLEQHVLARFLEGGHYEQHLSRIRKAYGIRRTAVLEAFRHCAFADRIQVAEQGAGLHFLLRLKTERSDEELRRRGEERGVRLCFLSDFAAQPRPDFAHTLVVNYAPLPPERLPEAMELLGEVLFPS